MWFLPGFAKSGKKTTFSYITFESCTQESKWIPFLESTDHFLSFETLFDYPPTKLIIALKPFWLKLIKIQTEIKNIKFKNINSIFSNIFSLNKFLENDPTALIKAEDRKYFS